MLPGRLGLETARLPHADRHGLIFLDRGRLTVEDGCLTFECAGGGATPAGRYGLPHQSVSLMLLGPGSTISHDALRLLARHNVGLAAVGADGVRFYTAPPLLPDFSNLARAQAMFWADAGKGRLMVARRMYALRLGEVPPHRDIAVLRGIEGARMKESYRIAAERAGIRWNGRHYDRQNPSAADLPNQALNHAASAVEGAAAIAVAATATIPQLGFIHEDSGQSFVLDVADLVRDTVTIPCAFRAAALVAKRPAENIERLARRMTGEQMRRDQLIAHLIDRIKTVLADATSEESAALPVRVRPRPPADSGAEPEADECP
ncbi:type I-E CRISPR-associated endonuclease Cas1 [Rhodoblastus sphagnicola]|uniref:CRISPR-associated endonuclease Cas1 n=1 Tax=Rhodoblastus sphagnicola TaxID=333368 RepID=A0A2S6NFU6_9HYPH|nr:type I-E CRISPR-associated endonuclease Cas1e [Rhodoblastus sphagnicola]MBB4199534.1 CRISPR-associated protein Cas1 [Rhodoblastus sphagnicola]PPQ33512.1 type I-E CRISPR-associated endonuclease Cas1 [Rhodoblastus sphagnicola]